MGITNPQTHTYSADQVLVVFGPYSLEGRGPDTFCTVERAEDSFKTVVGADGEVTRVRNLKRHGTITVTLMQTSKSNADLQGQILIDEATPNGLAIWPALVKDYDGNVLWTADESWLQKPAKSELGAEVGTREWVIACAQLNPPLPAHA